jgi:hypothetical protein
MADEMTPQPNLIEQYTKSVQSRKIEAEAQMQKLMKALDSRRNLPFDPMLMRVAGALLQPTKTGGAGESIGYAATAAADEAQRQVLQNAELAKMEFELFQKQQAQKSAMDEQNFAMQYFGSKRPPAAPVAPVATEPQLTTMPPTEALPLSDKPQMSTPNRPALLPEDMPRAPVAAPPTTQATVSQAAPPVDQSSQADDEDDPVLAIINPNLYKIKMELRDQARKSAEESRKREQLELDRRKTEATERVPVEVGGVKISMSKADFDRMTDAIGKGDFGMAEKLYTKYGIPFPFIKDGENYRLKTPSESAREKAVAENLGQVDRSWKGETYKLDSFQAAEHDKARKEKTLNEFWNKFFAEQSGEVVSTAAEPRKDVAPQAGEVVLTTAKPRKDVVPIPSVEQKEVSQEAAKTRERKRAEETINYETGLTETAKQAANSRRTASSILRLINDERYSGAQGYFSQPNLKNAIATFLTEGFQFGNSRVALPGLTEAFKKIGMTDDQVNAEAILFQKTGELALLVSKLQSGQGSVSDYERSLFKKIATSTETPLIAMRSATNALIARSTYDENIQKIYVNWSEKNPNKSSAAFIASPEYKRELARYDKQLSKIEDEFFPKTKAAPAAKPATKPDGKPSSKFLQ